MNLFELFVKIGVDDQASGALAKITGGLGKGLAAAAKVGVAAVGAAAAGITALTTQAINSFAEYEQLAGGAAKIFDELDQSKILADAQNAYQTLGMSANQYLAVMNDVGATFASTMGDEAGYEAAQVGLQAIADYASGTGKNVDELADKFMMITRSTSSYQSIADQFSGILPATSAGFLEQAQAAGLLSDKYTELSQVPIDEYQAAVAAMLEQGVADLGLAGNTAAEAMSTISGSLAMTRASWSNLVAGLADDNADLGMLIDNFVTSVSAAASNLIPVISTALTGASQLVTSLIPVLADSIPTLIEENLPVLADAAMQLIQGLLDGLTQNQESLITTAMSTITFLLDGFLQMLPQIIQLGLDMLVSLANGIAQSLPTLIPTIVSVVLQIVETLTNPESIGNLVEAALAIIIALAEGLIDALPQLIESIPVIIQNLVSAIAQNLPTIIQTGITLLVKLGAGIIQAIPQLLAIVPQVVNSLVSGFSSLWTSFLNIGSDIIAGIKQGITNAWNNMVSWFSGLFGDLIGIAKQILGIASPSKVFASLGEYSAEGFGIGFERAFSGVEKDIKDSLDFSPAVNVGDFTSSRIRGVGGVYGSGGSVTIVQNIYSKAKSAAELMQEALYQQERAVYLGV